MPRHPDIGWQHGKMVGGHRHHVQCNYCHRVMIGGITRFKKHLAGKRGEIKGCDAAPQDVRDAIRKHLAALKARRASRAAADGFAAPSGSDSDELDDMHADSPKSSDHQYVGGTREFFDVISSISDKEQGSAPRRATDLGWAHGTMVNNDRQKIKCRYCDKVILGGGISRLKQHLAGERGNIAPCEKVPDEVKAQMQKHLGYKVLKRLNKQKELEVIRASVIHAKDKGYNDDIPIANSTQGVNGRRRGKEVEEDAYNKRKGTKMFVAQASIAQSISHSSFISQERSDQADIAVAKFMYHAGLPFSEANSSYFQQMADAIATVGTGYKIPSYHSLQGGLLDKCAVEIGETCKELRKSWEVTGCTVMVDRWMDITGRAMIDFFVYCPKGTLFLKTVDVFDIENSLDNLVNLIDSIIQEVGPKNIVNILTDSMPYYKAAARVLLNKYKTFFCSICANHCIELMLIGIGKMDEVKAVLGKAAIIHQLIYDNAWVLNLMRKEIEERDIFQPGMTNFLTKFLTLESIVSLKDRLYQMVASTTWEQSTLSRQRQGLDVIEILSDTQFWLSCTKVMKIFKPLMTVLNLADSKERPSIGYIYDAIEKAKREIVSAFDTKEFLPYLEVVNQAQEEFYSPLYAAAYYLNPSIYYNPNFSITSAIQKGLLDCIETLEPDLMSQDNITREKVFYEDAVGDFSRPVALRGRESLTPATWWSLYASDYPDLQRFAVRILSQTCSIVTYDRERTMDIYYHSRRNRLELQRSNNLTFVHYNLRLQHNKQRVASGLKSLPKGECDHGVLEGEGAVGMVVALPSIATLSRKDNTNLGIYDGGPDESDKSDDSTGPENIAPVKL